jgi:serine/threonine protein kinase
MYGTIAVAALWQKVYDCTHENDDDDSYGGDFRDPREYVGSYVDESVDIPPMGYSIFILLTGLWPYYEYPYDERETLQSLAIAGTLPYINSAYKTRSLIEKRMVEIMYRCMAQKASDRPDIFEVLRYLYETRSLHRKESQKATASSKLRR